MAEEPSVAEAGTLVGLVGSGVVAWVEVSVGSLAVDALGDALVGVGVRVDALVGDGVGVDSSYSLGCSPFARRLASAKEAGED